MREKERAPKEESERERESECCVSVCIVPVCSSVPLKRGDFVIGHERTLKMPYPFEREDIQPNANFINFSLSKIEEKKIFKNKRKEKEFLKNRKTSPLLERNA